MKQNYSELPNGYLETIQNRIAGVRTYGIRDMYSGGFYPYPSKEIFWAY